MVRIAEPSVVPSAIPDRSERLITRRQAVRAMAAGAGLLSLVPGCSKTARADAGKVEKVWGDRGNLPGHFQRPRAVAADAEDCLYLTDLTDRVQVFSRDGEFLRHWRLPAFNVDGPTGLSFNRDGNLLVADTHFYQILIYSPDGELLEQIGGKFGSSPGEFGLVRDVVEDADGFLYVSETGDAELERIQVLSPEHKLVARWGKYGTGPGEFRRPEGLAFDKVGRLFACDSCNHRIQVFDKSGKLVEVWGSQGAELGSLNYPHDIAFASDGNLYVCEWGNNRVQKFTPDGKPLGAWGRPGRQPGELYNPWGLCVDRHDRIHVVDTYNYRVQRIVL